jgi:hypothetical protein
MMELDKVVNGLEEMLEESKYNDSIQNHPLDAAAGTAERTEEAHQRPCMRQRLLRIGVRAMWWVLAIALFIWIWQTM